MSKLLKVSGKRNNISRTRGKYNCNKRRRPKKSLKLSRKQTCSGLQHKLPRRMRQRTNWKNRCRNSKNLKEKQRLKLSRLRHRN